MKAATDTRTGPKRSAAGNFQLANSHHETGSLQARIAVWMREAERLAGEFNRTRREIHLHAFMRHVTGMIQALRRS
jgi:hypothetical protein